MNKPRRVRKPLSDPTDVRASIWAFCVALLCLTITLILYDRRHAARSALRSDKIGEVTVLSKLGAELRQENLARPDFAQDHSQSKKALNNSKDDGAGSVCNARDELLVNAIERLVEVGSPDSLKNVHQVISQMPPSDLKNEIGVVAGSLGRSGEFFSTLLEGVTKVLTSACIYGRKLHPNALVFHRDRERS